MKKIKNPIIRRVNLIGNRKQCRTTTPQSQSGNKYKFQFQLSGGKLVKHRKKESSIMEDPPSVKTEEISRTSFLEFRIIFKKILEALTKGFLCLDVLHDRQLRGSVPVQNSSFFQKSKNPTNFDSGLHFEFCIASFNVHIIKGLFFSAIGLRFKIKRGLKELPRAETAHSWK